MIASLRCHYAYLSITITRGYQRLFTTKYCIIVIAMQQPSATFTRLLVFSQAVKKDNVTINETATRYAPLQLLLCNDARDNAIYEVCSKSIRLFCIKHTTQRILQVLFNLLQSIPLGGTYIFSSASATSQNIS